MMTTNVSNTAIQINDNQALERDSCNPPEAVTIRLEGASDTKKRKEKKRRKSLGQLGRGRARKWPVEWLPTIKALHGAKARCGNSNSPTYKKIKYRLDGKERKLIGRIGLWPGKGFTLESRRCVGCESDFGDGIASPRDDHGMGCGAAGTARDYRPNASRLRR